MISNDQTIDDNTPDELVGDRNSMDDSTNKKREFNLQKHTEVIDRLVLQNKQLQKELNDADLELHDMEQKLNENSIKISKGLFYIGIAVMIYISYTANSQLKRVNEQMIEMNIIISQYKEETQKLKFYNDLVERKLVPADMQNK